MPFPFLILGVIVLMAVLIAGYMYLQWAKVRDSAATRDRG